MVPGVAVALDGLVEQDLVAVSSERRIFAGGEQHRHEPDADGRKERERAEKPARTSTRCLARLPFLVAQDRERNQDEQRQKSHAFRDHAESRRGPADRVPAP